MSADHTKKLAYAIALDAMRTAAQIIDEAAVMHEREGIPITPDDLRCLAEVLRKDAGKYFSKTED